MKISMWAFALTTALGGVAAAQPTDPGPPPTNLDPIQPVPVQPVQPPPPPVVEPPHASVVSPEAGERPADIAFGIGAGYEFPTPLEMLNNFSVRLRLVSGLTLEPRVVIQNISDDQSNSTQRFKLAMGIRAPLIHHGKFDFELLGQGVFQSDKTPTAAIPPMMSEESTRVSTLDLDWGVGIAWWITPHLELSAAATNPLVTFTKSSSTIAGATSTSSTDIGLIFDPRVAVMIHIFN